MIVGCRGDCRRSPDLAADRKPIHPRQHEVEDDERGAFAQHGLEAAVASLLGNDVLKARALERQPQHRPYARIILDDDDLVHNVQILSHFSVRIG